MGNHCKHVAKYSVCMGILVPNNFAVFINGKLTTLEEDFTHQT